MNFVKALPDVLTFELPSELEATEPPEIRGLSRDAVKLMVSYRATNEVIHTTFRSIVDFLEAGDVVVINTSGTMNAALRITRADGTPLELHLSNQLPYDEWLVEIREPHENATKPFYTAQTGEIFRLPHGATLELVSPYTKNPSDHVRLWRAILTLPMAIQPYLARYGFPIRYNYVKREFPLEYYQTVYATEIGSAEMPSAGRAFTPKIITQLIAKGVHIAPLILHTGVASLESHEAPYAEYYRVPKATAQLINAAHQDGGRVIAVGTTVVRALETVTTEDRITHAGEGWTEIFITPERGIYSVDGMLTGLHEPKATHLAMLAALANLEHLHITYQAAIKQRYLWHEFGDLHLILP